MAEKKSTKTKESGESGKTSKKQEEQKKTETTEASSTTKKTSSKSSSKSYEKKIVELAKQGHGPEKIGLELKKQGFNLKELKQKKKISDVLKENDLYENPDVKRVGEKLERIKTHYENNKQDKRAMRERDRIFSKLRRLKKHFGMEIKKGKK